MVFFQKKLLKNAVLNKSAFQSVWQRHIGTYYGILYVIPLKPITRYETVCISFKVSTTKIAQIFTYRTKTPRLVILRNRFCYFHTSD